MEIEMSALNGSAMTITSGNVPATSTTVSVGGTTGGGYWLNGEWFPNYVPGYWPSPYQYVSTYYPWFQYNCAGEVHVFGCEHAKKCKCGAASRKVAPKTCPSCGKAE